MKICHKAVIPSISSRTRHLHPRTYLLRIQSWTTEHSSQTLLRTGRIKNFDKVMRKLTGRWKIKRKLNKQDVIGELQATTEGATLLLNLKKQTQEELISRKWLIEYVKNLECVPRRDQNGENVFCNDQWITTSQFQVSLMSLFYLLQIREDLIK